MTREELAATAPDAWTPAHDAALAVLIIGVLAHSRTLIWRITGQAKQAAQWAAVWSRFHRAHMEQVHTGGVTRAKGDLVLNASAWPANDKSGRGQGRTPEQNTRVETW